MQIEQSIGSFRRGNGRISELRFQTTGQTGVHAALTAHVSSSSVFGAIVDASGRETTGPVAVVPEAIAPARPRVCMGVISLDPPREYSRRRGHRSRRRAGRGLTLATRVGHCSRLRAALVGLSVFGVLLNPLPAVNARGDRPSVQRAPAAQLNMPGLFIWHA